MTKSTVFIQYNWHMIVPLKFTSKFWIFLSFFLIATNNVFAKDNHDFDNTLNPWEESEKKDDIKKKISKSRSVLFHFVYESQELKKLFPSEYDPFTNPCKDHPVLLLNKAMSPPAEIGKKFSNKSIELIKTRLGALKMNLIKEHGKQGNKIYQKLYKEIMRMVTDYNHLMDDYNNIILKSSKTKRKNNRVS